VDAMGKKRTPVASVEDEPEKELAAPGEGDARGRKEKPRRGLGWSLPLFPLLQSLFFF
jgi:hypothetical protein